MSEDLNQHPGAVEAPPVAPPMRKRRPRRKAKHRANTLRPFKAPDEFAGMTEIECCGACAVGDAAAAVQRRLNEINDAYPRRQSALPGNPTVLEMDAEWLARNPQVADEFRKLTKAIAGHCVISGVGACGHPFKGGEAQLPRGDQVALARFNRAKKALAKRKIDLAGGP